MAWGQIIAAGIGAATSLFGASKADKAAKRSEQLQRQAMAQQNQIAQRQLDMGERAFDYQVSENEYRKEIEALNRQLEEENFLFGQNELRQFQIDRINERQYAIERQIRLDQDAAKQRADQLTERLRNQQLAENERQTALRELEEAQAIARGERTQDLRQFYENQVKLQAEQDYMRDQYEGALLRAEDERAYDMRFRDDLVSRIDGLRGALSTKQQSLGPAPKMAELTPEAIDAEVARRSADYTADVDRAADRVASVNEASLIRRGIDESTPGTARRGEVAERLAAAYQDATQRAYDDATSYITGRVSSLNDNSDRRFSRRGQELAEIASVEGAGIGELISLPQVSSTVGATQFANMIDTATYDRNIVSANDYRNPLNVNSSIYDRLTPGSGMGATLNAPSAAVGEGMNLRRQLVSPYGSQNPGNSASPFFSGAASGTSSLVNAATSNFNGAQARSADAFGSLGSSFADLFDEGWSAWQNRNSGGPTIAQKQGG